MKELKAEDLRIGNWLNGSNNGFSKDVQVYEFDHEHIRHSDKHTSPLTYDKFKPIPLTPEELGKLGFNEKKAIFKMNRLFQLGEFKIEMHVECNDFICLNLLISISIEHVHQLQNLYFALTGEEITYTNQ